MIQINISNKVAYTFIAITILIALGGIVYAYGGSQPEIMGHSAGEIVLQNGQNLETAFQEINSNSELTPGDISIANAGDTTHVGHDWTVVKKFKMGTDGSANFNADIESCRIDKTFRIRYRKNEEDIEDTLCETNTKTSCSSVLDFNKGDEIKMMVRGTKYCSSIVSDIHIRVDNAPTAEILPME